MIVINRCRPVCSHNESISNCMTLRTRSATNDPAYHILVSGCRFIVPTRSAHQPKPMLVFYLFKLRYIFWLHHAFYPARPLSRRRSYEFLFSAQCRPRLRHPKFCCFSDPFDPANFTSASALGCSFFFSPGIKVLLFRFCPQKIIFDLLRWSYKLDWREFLAWFRGKT